jgi:hypothetical protein
MTPDRATISRSDRPNKLLAATLINGDRRRVVYFGAPKATQYPIHRDKSKRAAYIKRHQVNENWRDPYSAGFWSRWLLWNKKTISASAKWIEQQFGFPVTITP